MRGGIPAACARPKTHRIIIDSTICGEVLEGSFCARNFGQITGGFGVVFVNLKVFSLLANLKKKWLLYEIVSEKLKCDLAPEKKKLGWTIDSFSKRENLHQVIQSDLLIP